MPGFRVLPQAQTSSVLTPMRVLRESARAERRTHSNTVPPRSSAKTRAGLTLSGKTCFAGPSTPLASRNCMHLAAWISPCGTSREKPWARRFTHSWGGLHASLCECYGGGGQGKTTIREAARASMEAGFKLFRTEVIGPGLSDTGTSSRGATNWNPHQAVLATFKRCQEAREGVGEEGDFICDFHGKLDMSRRRHARQYARTFAALLGRGPGSQRGPSPVSNTTANGQSATRDGNAGKVELRELIEDQLIDYARVRLPNCGGITEYMKIASMCEAHFAGLSPEGTGPISTAAEVHVAAATNVPFLLQVGGAGTRPYLPQML